MNKASFLSVAIISVLLSWIFLPHSLFAGVRFQQLDFTTAKLRASEQDQLFFLYFSADWCMPCQWMEAETFQEDRLSEFIAGHYIPVKVVMGTGDSKVLQEQFEVTTLPTILVFSVNGQLVDRKEGSLEAGKMLRWLRRLDRPAHHLSRLIPADEASKAPNVLAAPTVDVAFERPALVPIENQLTSTENTDNPEGQMLAYAPRTPDFQARTGQYYTVRLKTRCADYQEAIQTVTTLERKLNERVEMILNEDNTYTIHIGRTGSHTAANQLLLNVQRHDLEGELVRQ